jgi:hypothetical protein
MLLQDDHLWLNTGKHAGLGAISGLKLNANRQESRRYLENEDRQARTYRSPAGNFCEGLSWIKVSPNKGVDHESKRFFGRFIADVFCRAFEWLPAGEGNKYCPGRKHKLWKRER